MDFYIPKAKLVIEVDGSHHLESEPADKDRERDAYMISVGIQVLRFNSIEVLKETDAVVNVIARAVLERLNLYSDPVMAKQSPVV